MRPLERPCVLVLVLVLAFAARAHARDKQWGVGTHLPGLARSDEIRAALRELGVNSFRDDLQWRFMERERGQFAWPKGLTSFGDVVAEGAQHGIRPIAILNYGNPLYFTGIPKTPAEIEAFARYARFVARRLAGSVFAFELWNEWNLGAGTRPQEPGSASDYVHLLERVRAVMAEEARDVPLIAGAVANRDMSWIRRFGELGGFALCDGFSVHPYNYTARDASAEEVVRWLDALHREIKKSTDRAVPIYVSEIGWPNHAGPGGSAEALSAQRLLKFMLLAAARDYIGGVWWYDLIDDGVVPHEREHHFGLVRKGGARKPAFAAYKLFLDHFKDARLVRETSERGAFLLEFRDAHDRRLIAAWTTEQSFGNQLHVSGSYRLLPIEGADNRKTAAQLRAAKTLQLGAWPALLVLEDGAQARVSWSPEHPKEVP